MTCGIYKIVNRTNSKYYLGSSVNIEKRYTQHISDLRGDRHHSMYLQRAFHKYGEQNFFLVIIVVCSQDDLKTAEQSYLDRINLHTCYNVSIKASGGDLISYHPNRTTIAGRISESIQSWMNELTDAERKEKFGRSGEQNPNWRGGTTFCSCGARISPYAATCAACQDCTGINNPFYGKAHSRETKQMLREAARKRYEDGFLPSNTRRVCIDGVEYESVTAASRVLNVVPATIIYRIRSKSHRFVGYHYID